MKTQDSTWSGPQDLNKVKLELSLRSYWEKITVIKVAVSNILKIFASKFILLKLLPEMGQIKELGLYRSFSLVTVSQMPSILIFTNMEYIV